MALTPVALATQSSHGRTGRENAARLINAYAEPTGDEGKHKFAVYACEGLGNAVELSSSGGVRGQIAIETDMYVVCGRDVIRYPLAGSPSVIYTLPGDGPVYMARNRRTPDVQIGVVTDGVYYVIQSGSMAAVTDPDLPPPTSIDVLDGYFLLPTTEGRWFISGEDDATSISALDFGEAQRQPDEIVRVLASEREAVLFGSTSIEWWQNNPDASASFPFIPSAAIEVGCYAPRAVVKLDRTVAFIANDGTVRVLSGYSAERISNFAVERSIGATDGSDIYAFAYHCRDSGHSYLTFTSSTWTWQYNLKTGLWHERETYGRDRWRGSYACEFAGTWYVGDDADGRIYTVSKDHAADGDQPLVATCQTPTVHAFPARLKVNVAFVDIATGFGTATETDPQIILDMSHDGGASWSSERQVSLGSDGDRLRRVRINRLGVVGPNGVVFRLRVSAAVVRCLMSLTLDTQQLAA